MDKENCFSCKHNNQYGGYRVCTKNPPVISHGSDFDQTHYPDITNLVDLGCGSYEQKELTITKTVTDEKSGTSGIPDYDFSKVSDIKVAMPKDELLTQLQMLNELPRLEIAIESMLLGRDTESYPKAKDLYPQFDVEKMYKRGVPITEILTTVLNSAKVTLDKDLSKINKHFDQLVGDEKENTPTNTVKQTNIPNNKKPKPMPPTSIKPPVVPKKKGSD